LVTLIITHADAAIVLPLTTLIRLISADPGVETQCRVHGTNAIEEYGRRRLGVGFRYALIVIRVQS